MSFRRDFITKPIYQCAQLVLRPSTASEAVARVVAVDDFAPEALSPIYKHHPLSQTQQDMQALSANSRAAS